MIITVSSEDLKADISDSRDCPLFRALKRQGYNVTRVGVNTCTIDNKLYILNDKYIDNLVFSQLEGNKPVDVDIEGLEPLPVITKARRSFWYKIKSLLN